MRSVDWQSDQTFVTMLALPLLPLTRKHDEVGRLTATVTPLSERTRYVRDRVGNLLDEIDPLERATSYTYDELNRVETVTNNAGETYGYDYDERGNLVSEALITEGEDYRHNPDPVSPEDYPAMAEEQNREKAAESGIETPGSSQSRDIDGDANSVILPLSDRQAELIAGAETLVVGAGLVATGAKVAAAAATAAGVVAGGFWVVVGGGIIWIGYDLIEGGGLDRIDDFIQTHF
jgi:YD repeat-containing protein